MERYKGKDSIPCLDDKIAMKEIGSTQLQDYKFKKMQNKYGSEKLAQNFKSGDEGSSLPNVDKYYNSIQRQLRRENEVVGSQKNRS